MKPPTGTAAQPLARRLAGADTFPRHRLGPNRVELDGPVALGAEPRSTALFVAFLRDSATYLTRVEWRGTLADTVDPALLHHLPPPLDLGAGSDEVVARWRARYRYGACYYRCGPGFILVKDVRVAASAARYTLDDPVLVATFLRCREPTALNALTDEQREAASLLHAERLVLRMADVVVGLPIRMLHWPIPAMAV
jgi:Family of unknown function (DUF5825)